MVFVTSHKRYVFLLAGFAISSLGLVFDFDGGNRIARYNAPNIAHYDLRYDAFPPTARLFKVAFLDSIEKFSDRDTVVLIGNSVIAGAGAKDKQFLNSSLSKTFNVINAGLGGEYLGASSALAVLGIDAIFKKHPSAFHHIFVAYPPSRMYVGGYWATGHALTSLARERNLSGYIFPYSISVKGNIKQRILMIKSTVAENMRCIVDGNVVTRSIVNREFYCEKPFNTENGNPVFLQQYADRMNAPSLRETMALSVAMRDNTFIDSESRRNDMAGTVVQQLEPLERFLGQNGIPHKIYFLLLRDAPDAIDTLPRERQEGYKLGRMAFVKALAGKRPQWEVLESPSMDFGDFFDMGHMREGGQTRTANLIKAAIGRDQVARQREVEISNRGLVLRKQIPPVHTE